MTNLFLTIIKMSLNASIVICLVLLLRVVARKAPKWLKCGLWLLVAFRLLIPVSFESSFSIIPDGVNMLDSTTVKNDELAGCDQVNSVQANAVQVNHNGDVTYDADAYKEFEIQAADTYFELSSDDLMVSENDESTSSLVLLDMADETDSVVKDYAGTIGEDSFGKYEDLSTVFSSTGSTPIGVLDILPYIWLSGMLMLVLYYVFSYIRLKRTLAGAVPLRAFDDYAAAYADNRVCPGMWNDISDSTDIQTDLCNVKIYVCDEINTPFVIGLLKPRIYLPSGLDKTTVIHVLAHERKHLKRGDHIWKPIGLFALALHWFNPLAWLSYYLFARDVEAACDEAVIKGRSREEIKSYAVALLRCSCHEANPLLCSLAFGEISVKKRIKDISEYSKPRLRVIISVILIGTMISACTLTDPIPKSDDTGNVESQTGTMEDSLSTTTKNANTALYLDNYAGADKDNTHNYGDVSNTADNIVSVADMTISLENKTDGKNVWVSKLRSLDKASNMVQDDIKITEAGEIAYFLNGMFVVDESLRSSNDPIRIDKLPTAGSARRIADDTSYLTVIDDKGMVYSTFPLSSEEIRAAQKIAVQDALANGGNYGMGHLDPWIAQDLELAKDVMNLNCKYGHSYIYVDRYGRVFKDGARIYADDTKAVQALQGFTNEMTYILLENGRIVTPTYFPSKVYLQTHEDYREWRCVTEIAGEGENIIALCADGSVLCAEKTTKWKVRDWENIKSIVYRYGNILGVDTDGKVHYEATNARPLAENAELLSVAEIQAQLAMWENVLDVDCNSQYIAGLTTEGVKVLKLFK